MKKIILSLGVLALSFGSLKAVVVYNDFSPDLSLTFGGTLSFDLDGDMNDDITFTSSGTGMGDYVISASGTDVAFAAQAGGGTAYTESLFIGKLVDANKNWSAGAARLASAVNKDIAGNNEFFIGLRVNGNNGNFFYGWLLVELKSSLELVIKSSAFETSASSIVVGNTGAALISLEELEQTKIDIYPTVVQDRVNFETEEEILAVKIFSTSGVLVAVPELNGQSSINLSDLNSGNYILEIEMSKGQIIRERLLKQ